jgi:hypothetical protein
MLRSRIKLEIDKLNRGVLYPLLQSDHEGGRFPHLGGSFLDKLPRSSRMTGSQSLPVRIQHKDGIPRGLPDFSGGLLVALSGFQSKGTFAGFEIGT